MHRLLEGIVNNTKAEVKRRKSQIIKDSKTANKHFSFKENVLNPKIGDIGLIAEIKLASPTIGKIGKEVDILSRIQDYQDAKADAISIITEKKNFKGDLDLIFKAKKLSILPILQKDFVIDEFQIEESKKIGADALLLIARIVTLDQLKDFVRLCYKLNLEPVVEICNKDDLEKAIKSDTEIIAVNARDLDTFEVNVDKACELLKQIPKRFVKLGFSGIHSKVEVEKYKKAGANAVLVGTELMKTNDIDKFIRELKNVS